MSSEPPEETPEIRLRLDTAEGSVHVTPEETSPELEALLAEEDADTLVFVPLWDPAKAWKKPGLVKTGRRLEGRRKKLGEGDWREGAVERGDGEVEPVPGAWCTDVRRFRARMIGEALGTSRFYWACRGGPLEEHDVAFFDSDEPFEFESVRALSREGLRNMRQTAVSLDRLPEATAAVGSDMRRLKRTALLLAGISVVACVLAWILILAGLGPSESSPPALARVHKDLPRLLHPVLVPALVLGAYMRRHLGLGASEAAGRQRRELTRDEIARAWNDTAPHLLAVWLLAASSVVMLTVARHTVKGELDPVELVDTATSSCLILLWILTPLTYSRDTSSAIGACLEAGITVVVSLVVLKITAIVATMATGAFWRAVSWVVPYTIPEWIREPFDALTSIAAELVFFTLILGYTWTKTREHFGRWATLARERTNAA